MKALISDTKAIYRDAGAFAVTFPLLFLIPVGVEMAQHVVELQAGMYVSEAGAKVAEADPLRLQFGFAKTLALLLPGYWFVRFIALGDRARAARIEWPAFGLWLVLFAFSAAQMWWGLFGPDLAELTGMKGQPAQAASIALQVFEFILAIYLTAWVVAWPLGNKQLGPLRSFALMQGSFWHAVGLMVTGMAPLMAVHYGLAIAAVVALPDGLDWLAMVIDSIVVGFLALTLAGSVAYAAIHAARRKGVDLAPSGSLVHLSPAPAST
jgi:hypothetical protein